MNKFQEDRLRQTYQWHLNRYENLKISHERHFIEGFLTAIDILGIKVDGINKEDYLFKK